ncbi:Basic helix-loop-helix DNA-binding superfamily protein [Hibiscus syriacus]|uniref:Basic helix-loop-helix DNA-binding superfamily protein n=1 Tax=Hibiscus syriacus TaxID=106335 RepID=A0A6A2XHN0_HIBSY|nr:Basic helix-loop-helix DNA-binding superfamily protein [Hibiscus syriacus]
MNVVIASSSIDDDIGYWDLQTGAEQLHYKTCASPPHGLASIDSRFLACSQLHDPSGHVLYWSWSKPQAQVKSFPVEHIKPLAANSLGSYIVGGGSSDDIYFWEVATGRSEKIKELGLEGKQRDEYYAWGLHEVAKAVSVLNNDCKLDANPSLTVTDSRTRHISGKTQIRPSSSTTLSSKAYHLQHSSKLEGLSATKRPSSSTTLSFKAHHLQHNSRLEGLYAN